MDRPYRIDAKGVYYKDLNDKIHEAIAKGAKEITLVNVNGQRYIGGGIKKGVHINIEGVPGNDLAAFMDGPIITVKSNAQDAVCNTMNSGKVIVWGDAGDVLGYGMRGGKLLIKGDVGYRVGIHMKAYKDQVPVLIAGGVARDFLAEYMAGGVIILLGLNNKTQSIVGNYTGTGMHGGVVYIQGKIEPHQLGAEVNVLEPTKEDMKELKNYLAEYCQEFKLDLREILRKKFIKLTPHSSRPYGELYCY